MAVNEHALDFLASLERAEAAVVTWGLVDGFFSEAELERRAEDFLAAQAERGIASEYGSGWDLLEALLDEDLLWRVPDTERYRTRMAETVRLLARLKQVFPDPRFVAWRSAPALVADYRLRVSPRLYPRREVRPSEVLDAIRDHVPVSTLQEAVIRALVRSGTAEERPLARFQVRATGRILRAVGSERSVGTVISAGTGSGKTLAFYLPACAAMAALVSGDYWTKCLALYPRNELLKDQLREALASARRVGPALVAAGKRKLVLGALYGGVPRTARDVVQPGGATSWRRIAARGGTAYECPFVRCPQCGGAMAWADIDVGQGLERLLCVDPRCEGRVEPDEVRLTRDRMFAEPPDMLFTSTEMLNQRLSSARFGRLFGIGLRPDRRPIFVLLDEAHAYEGVHGAHVALLLRRWRRASDARPHFVGLSATLADAARFFGELVGIGPGDIGEVSPEPDEMRGHGSEYMLALRGDPSSGTSLLSTTIQALMLLRRVLAPGRQDSHFGSRVFAFTDNLDVINRLYHNLLDAEGWDAFGRPNPRRATGSLANLRGTTLPNARERLEAGQNWALVEEIGHVLAPGSRIRISRTSSQDTGVDSVADIIVATSALEVGFDDPDVGAILQHKAPHSPAALLQRKGRAGRRAAMRPWTVMVLSDYGRDRTAYQAYDQLFSPQLPPRHLPLRNRAVLRMQATYVLFDWLARRLPRNQSPEPWTDLSQPADEINHARFAEGVRVRQGLYAEYLRALLEEETVRQDFINYLARSLATDEQEVQALLWEPPRAILTEAIPTLLRRLERGWRRAEGPEREAHVARAPLPEFVPRTLFSDLQLPDVWIRIPPLGRLGARIESMPLTQALREFAPGRVSRRFGVSHGGERHWVSPGNGSDVHIDSICPVRDRQELGRFRYADQSGAEQEIPVFRPHALDVALTPLNVQQSSNAFLEWQAEIVPTGDGHEVDIPDGCHWGAMLRPFRFHTHHLGLPVELRRFAVGAIASVGRGQQPQVVQAFRFVCSAFDGGSQPAALGLVADVDAVQVAFEYPGRLSELCSVDKRLLRGVRTARFRHLIRTARELDGIANLFQRDWLSQAYLSTVTAEALRAGSSLEVAEAAVHGRTSTTTVLEVLETMLQWGEGDSDSEADDSATDDDVLPRRLRELAAILDRTETQTALHGGVRALWQPIDAEWEPWLRARFRSTLGAALVDAAHVLCPQMDPGALVVDVDARRESEPGGPVPSGGQMDELWLTEAAIGGGGFVEEFLARYAEDPRRYFRLLDAALGPTELESVGEELGRVLQFAALGGTEHEGLVGALAAVRNAASHEESVGALGLLRAELAHSGLQPTPTLLVALNSRILRPGTNADTDLFLAGVRRELDEAERRLGIDIDARVVALVKSSDSGLERALGLTAAGDSDRARAAWRYGVLYGMLWPRGYQIRAESLRASNPFVRPPECDRLLVLASVSRPIAQVALARDRWVDELAQLLVRNGVAELVCHVDESASLASALLQIAAQPVDSEALLIYPRLTGVRRDGSQMRAELELPEAFQ